MHVRELIVCIRHQNNDVQIVFSIRNCCLIAISCPSSATQQLGKIHCCFFIRLELKETVIKVNCLFSLHVQVIAANHQPSSSREKIESSTNDEMTHTSSTHDTPNRRHHRYSRTSPQSLSISSQKDGKQRAAYVWIKKEDDEWDKTALLLAEHMRNTVKEFPTLADDFRTRLLQFTLDVQKKRSEMRTQNSINFAYIDMDDS